ncbi:MAG: D-alanyl-D-alanine carboxypeptidase family protein, partial [Pseudomonadota bacterium]
PAPAAAMPVPPPPAVPTRAYALLDVASNQVLAAMNENQRMEPASLTKLMTAYVVFHALEDGKLKLEQEVPISEYAWRTGGAKSGGSTSFLDLGSRVRVVDLIQGMIVQSGNDASIALAEAVAGNEATFAVLMNQHAKRLGMTGTNWTNSPGLPDPNQYTTARDLAILCGAIIREFPQYYRWYSQREFTFNGITQRNRNGLLDRDPSVDGIKTGHTSSAGYNLASSSFRNGMRLVSVVMGSDGFRTREDASAALLGYGFSFFESRRLYRAGQQVGTTTVFKFGDPINVVVRRDLVATAPRGQFANVRAQLILNPRLVAPLAANQPIGKVRVSMGDRVIAELPAFPQQAVEPGNVFRRLIDTVRLWLA